MSDDGGLSPAGLDRMRRVLTGFVESGELPGLVALVQRRGRTHVIEAGSLEAGGADPMRRDALFRIASLTKPVTAVAAMILVEECRLRLDDPLHDLLPELADRRVLRRPGGPVDDTVPAERPITLRDALTFTLGYGLMFTPEGLPPITQAMMDAGVDNGPDGPACAPDEWLKRLGTLPLAHQPGAGWLYNTGADVAGVAIARASGRPLEEFLRERIFEPLGMRDTGFTIPAAQTGRLAASYATDPGTGALARRPDPRDGAYDRPPVFPAGSGGPGLVSTVDDYRAFLRMLLDGGRYPGGRYPGGRLLSRPSVELMTTDRLTPEQKAGAGTFLGSGGWGFCLGVDGRRDDLFVRPGRFGWTGGLGTSAYADPGEDMIGVIFTQRAMTSPQPPHYFQDFWTTAYAAIDD
ncbi:serine hydrolase domain-containing protein [Actinomadura opuntiae]|uniref:serine hydrolase domain-containing protein n=1 Tax=Actinomadura sp. OS1-43 TaxID=604315 RepID=UPI00255B11AF|nr:serine hydrolase domain-containing protein [Actinomadura sp. OS1-43]MDL4814482.1 serine hydrolase domain-containing protein [Actinomadura sp. OS1-43]